MSKSPKKSKSPTKNGQSPKKNGSTMMSNNNNSNSNNSNGVSNNNSKSNGNNLIYQCRKVSLGITHEVGILDFYSGRLVWRAANDPNLKHEIGASDIKSIEWLNVDKRRKMMKIAFTDKTRPHFRLVGFAGEDEFEIDKCCRDSVGHTLSPKGVCVKGWNWGRFVLRHQEMVCRTEDKHILFTIPYNQMNQCVIQAKNELSFEFNPLQTQLNERNAKKQHEMSLKNCDQLMEMRIYIPDDDSNANQAAYEEFHSLLQKKAKLEQDKSLIIAWFDQIVFRMPRGKKTIQFYPNHFIFRSAKNSYKIEYNQVKRLFLFEQPGDKIAFLVNLKQAVRQGGATYDCLIMEFPNDEQCTTEINANEEELKSKYTSRDGSAILTKRMNGPTYDILSRVFMALSKIKIIAAKNFTSSTNDRCVRAVHQAANGLLYPLEKSIFFIWIPAFIKHSDIDYVEFRRVDDSQHVKMFDLAIYLLKRPKKPLMFTSIDKSEYEPLVRYFLDKPNVTLADRQMHHARINQTMTQSSRSTRTRKNIKQSNEIINDIGFGEDEDDEDDDDYDMGEDEKVLEKDKKYEKEYEEMVDKNNIEMLDKDKIIPSDQEQEDDDIEM